MTKLDIFNFLSLHFFVGPPFSSLLFEVMGGAGTTLFDSSVAIATCPFFGSDAQPLVWEQILGLKTTENGLG
jgi:hypothetical protein